MDVDDVGHDEQRNLRARSETDVERLDRNWSSLLQELRVVQTGVQLLTGFLLTLPFQARFPELGTTMRVIYLVTVSCSIMSTVLLTAPVGLHRLLFRRHRLGVLVKTSHFFALTGLVFLGAAMTGVAILVFDAVSGPKLAWIAGATAALALVLFWLVTPLALRGGPKDPDD
ncbi:MAG: DUF6328 family protein [Mycobacterium sp.]